jgi:hypothetical protein
LLLLLPKTAARARLGLSLRMRCLPKRSCFNGKRP